MVYPKIKIYHSNFLYPLYRGSDKSPHCYIFIFVLVNKKMSQIKKFQKTFSEKVIEVVKKIPAGQVLTYGEVARRSGSIGAARAVGNIMKKNSDKNVPCHRVVGSDGNLCKYNMLYAEGKRKVLEKEGVKFTKTGKIIF